MAISSSDIDGRSGILVSGPAGAFRALGAFGRPAYENFAQLQSTLRGKASPACLAYFARPTFDAEQKEFRWTAPAAGAIRPWRELNDAERQAGEAALVQVGAELAGLREQFRQRGGQSLAYASLLDEAVKVPPHEGDDWHFLYLVGQQPVAAFWGFETHDGRWFDPTAARARPAAPAPVAPSAVPAAAATAAATPPPPAAPALRVVPPPSTPPAATPKAPPPLDKPTIVPLRTATLNHGTTLARRPWWAFWQGGTWGRVLGGLLGLLLLGLLLLLLLRGCGSTPVVAPVTGGSQEDRQSFNPPPAMATAPGNAPPAPAGPLPAAPLQAAPDAPRDGAAAPPPGPAPATTSPPPADAPAATSPPGAAPARPLQGQWRAGEDLFDQNTGQPLDLTFAFGPDGNGKVTMRRPDGSNCSGAVASKVNGPRTTIEGASIPCAGGGSYAPPRVECTRASDGPLLCFGINPDGSRYRMAMRPAN